LARWTGLPAPLLLATGVFLLAYAGAAAWMARRALPPRRLIGLVVFAELQWMGLRHARARGPRALAA